MDLIDVVTSLSRLQFDVLYMHFDHIDKRNVMVKSNLQFEEVPKPA
jgi:hypothetical protein